MRYPLNARKSIFPIYLKGCIGDGVGAMRDLREVDRNTISYVCILVDEDYHQATEAFWGIRKDLMKRTAAFTCSRPARPSRHHKECPFPGNRVVGPGGYVGFDPDARDLI